MRRFATIGSTNRYVLDEARAGTIEGLVVVADHQRAGRGRLDRRWESPPGASLLLSVLLRPDLTADRLHLVSAAMALAAADACETVAGVRPGIKWPNDLVLPDGPEGGGTAKLAGVLAEAELPAVAVGIGLNLDWPPGDLPPGATALGPVDRDDLMTVLLDRLGAARQDWDDVARRYRDCCVTIGRAVRVELAGETLTGTAVTLTGEGWLVVDTGSGGVRAVGAGDVVHLRCRGPRRSP